MAKSISNHLHETWNLIHIYQEDQRVITRIFYKNSTIISSFKNYRIKNISELLFPDKAQNLNRRSIYAAFYNFADAFVFNGKVFNKWTYFLEILAEKLNGTLNYEEITFNKESVEKYRHSILLELERLLNVNKFDFFINNHFRKSTLNSYSYEEFCFIVPFPPKYSIFELVLILPLDISCWMWLGISVAVSFILWSIAEGFKVRWDFLFGIYAFFLGQNAKIQT